MSGENTTLLAAVRDAAAPGYAGLTIEGLREHRPDLVQAIAAESAPNIAAARTEGEKAGAEAGARAERTRIAAIHKAAFAGQDKLVQKAIDEGLTAEAAALSFIEDYKAHGQHLAALKSMDDKAQVPAAPTANQPGAKVEKPVAQNAEGWKAEYASNEALQREFASADSYAAFKAAEKDGRVRVKSTLAA